MSDILTQYYNTFVAVNGCHPKKFLCIWHVDKTWKEEELRNKVPNPVTQVCIYGMLRTLLEETDEAAFNDSVDILITSLSSTEETKNFLNYFLVFWLTKKEEWAYCYRLREGINTNMFAKAFHRVFKYKYLKGKVNKRVDTCLFYLVKFNRDKCFERVMKLTKGKSSKRLSVIHDRHRGSLSLSFDAVESNDNNSNSWLVQSSDSEDRYTVDQLLPKCNNPECMLRCTECNICGHMYQCQCPDALIICGPCKHVHLVHRYLTSGTDVPPPQCRR